MIVLIGVDNAVENVINITVWTIM